jgi:hypothetical protein
MVPVSSSTMVRRSAPRAATSVRMVVASAHMRPPVRVVSSCGGGVVAVEQGVEADADQQLRSSAGTPPTLAGHTVRVVVGVVVGVVVVTVGAVVVDEVEEALGAGGAGLGREALGGGGVGGGSEGVAGGAGGGSGVGVEGGVEGGESEGVELAPDPSAGAVEAGLHGEELFGSGTGRAGWGGVE